MLALRTLRSSTSVARRAPAMALRCESTSAPSVPQRTRQQQAEPAGVAEHQASGLTTSHPPKEVVTAEVISGAPVELQHRQVRIYRPTKATTQSGVHNTNHWRVDFDILQGAGRWENPLMGWASSADYMQGTHVKFRTKEDAIHFCEKQGWDYFLSQPREPKFKVKTYANNYVHSPGKIRLAHTK